MNPIGQALLSDRAVLRVGGPDVRSFLQGLLTQDVESLGDGELRYGALLTPQGRLRGDLFLWGAAEGVAVDVAAGFRDELVQALTLYRLRAKVEIAPTTENVAAAWGAQPAGEGWAVDPRLPGLGWRRVGTADGEADYRSHRITLGVADPAMDAIEPLYPIEANLDLLHGIDFRKGCFVGQETTSRMKRRGQIKTRIVALTHPGPVLAAGEDVLAGELRAGRTLSGIKGRSLALMRLDRAMNAELTVGDQRVALDVSPWLAPALAMETDAIQA